MSVVSKTANPPTHTHDYTLWMMKNGACHVTQDDGDGLKCDCCCSKETDTGLIPVAQTYDTYKCVDCDIVLSGYKLADKNLNKHILRNAVIGKRCCYIANKFKHRNRELRTLEGLLRFREGHVAFPRHMLLAKNQYRTIEGHWYCVLCSQEKDKQHYPACADVMEMVKRYVKDTKLISRSAGPLLFNSAVARALEPGWLECDSTASGGDCGVSDFAVLGDRANMNYVPGTRDKHHCNACGLYLHDFVEGDTLLGEHIYYTYNDGRRCSYIDRKYTTQQILYTLGLERFRRGMLAFPTLMFKSDHGYSIVAEGARCVVCAASAVPAHEHKRGCANMTNALADKLKHISMLSSY